MRIGIDLLWVRVGICGGTESFVRNLIQGFAAFDSTNEYTLFCARDNADSFLPYKKLGENIKVCVCPVDSGNRVKRIAWENLSLDRMAKQKKMDVMFIPVYSMPKRSKSGKMRPIPYVTVIHDLQALHYPEYFSKVRGLFLKRTWEKVSKESDVVVLTSHFTEQDLLTNYPISQGKTAVIPIPIISNHSGLDERALEEFGLHNEEYFYCVSSLLPHKNLTTLLRMMALRMKEHPEEKLVISGVGGVGNQENDFDRLVEELGLKGRVIATGFISNEKRDLLYEHCKLFLFPSLFEGFGMPPIEAMRKGKIVLTTDSASLKEVTMGKAVYVSAPEDETSWSQALDEQLAKLKENKSCETLGVAGGEDFLEYELETVVKQYRDLFFSLV